MRAVLLLLILAVVHCAPAFAQSSLRAATLKDITNLDVVISQLSKDVQEAGLTQSELKADVELKLRQNGIIVTPNSIDGMPLLYVLVSALSNGSGSTFVYHVEVMLRQFTRLANGAGADAYTWVTGTLAASDANRFRTSVRQEVQTLVDEFLKDYASVNPKK